MSLYMMVEIKDPEESNQILRKFSLSERIFESVRDFRSQSKNKEVLQRGIIMSIDLPKMNQFYADKKKALAQKLESGKENQNTVKQKALNKNGGNDNMLSVPQNLKTVNRKL